MPARPRRSPGRPPYAVGGALWLSADDQPHAMRARMALLRAVAEQDRIATRFSNGTENRTAGFVTADAGFGWHFGKVGAFESAGLAVQLTNLADKRYHEHQTDGVSGNELAAPGRGVALSLNGSF